MRRNNFKAYTNPKLGLYERFIEPDENSDSWRQRFFEAVNKEGMKRITKLFSLVGARHVDLESYGTIELFDLFSRGDISNAEFKYELQFLRKNIASSTRITTNGRSCLKLLTFDLKEIKFRTLSSVYPQIAEKLPIILTNQRAGRCHDLAVSVALAFKKPAKVVTGAMYTIHPQEMFLHSVVEKEVDGELCVIDATKNLVMKKSDYYAIFHVKPIGVIDNAQIRKDWKSLSALRSINGDYIKLYLTSRDEAIAKLGEIIAGKCAVRANNDNNPKFLELYINAMFLANSRCEESHPLVESYVSEESEGEDSRK